MYPKRPVYFFLALWLTFAAQAQSPSGSWNGVHTFGGSSAAQQKMTQADLIAKREAGYYDGLGKTVVNNYSFSSYSVGSINQNTTTVSIVGEGNSASVVNNGYNSGNLDGSISWTDISNSNVNSEAR